MDIEYIVLITDSLGSVRNKIDWDCLSKTEWSLYQIVHNNMANIRVATRLYPATSIDVFCSNSITLCSDT